METANIIRLTIAIIAGYAAMFIIIWLVRKHDKKDKDK